jgi:hypothetical protein
MRKPSSRILLMCCSNSSQKFEIWSQILCTPAHLNLLNSFRQVNGTPAAPIAVSLSHHSSAGKSRSQTPVQRTHWSSGRYYAIKHAWFLQNYSPPIGARQDNCQHGATTAAGSSITQNKGTKRPEDSPPKFVGLCSLTAVADSALGPQSLGSARWQ